MTYPKYTTPTTPENIVERFWSKVDKSAGPGGCWLWLPVPTGRYGEFCIGHQETVGAHRFAYELTHGPLAEGMLACHTCDTPRCVNPAHLFEGTHLDNNRDMHGKGRGQRGDKHSARLRPETRPRGEQHGCAKLTAADVLLIRQLAADGSTGKTIAEHFGIGRTQVSRILNRQTWRHIA